MVKTLFRHKVALFILSIVFTLMLLEIILRLGGWVFLLNQERKNLSNIRNDEFRILCLGESTTAAGGMNSYPSQLQRILNSRKASKPVRVINKGVPGTKTFIILSSLQRYLDTYKPHMVIVMMGVNDRKEDLKFYAQTNNVDSLSFESMRVVNLFKLMLKHLSAKAGSLNYSTWDRTFLGLVSFEQGRWAETEMLYRSIIKESPKDYLGYHFLGRFYRETKQLDKEGLVYQEAITNNSRQFWAYNLLADYYLRMSDFIAVQELAGKFLSVTQDDIRTSMMLGDMYSKQNRFDEALKAYTIAIEGNDEKYYRKFLDLCFKTNNTDKINSFIERTSKREDAELVKVVKILEMINQWGYAEQLLLKAMEHKQRSLFIDEALSCVRSKNCYEVFKNDNLDLKGKSYEVFSNTKHNYLRLIEMVERYRIPIIAVQYPMRSVEPLKEVLSNQRIYFVDNERSFKEAVKDKGYWFYFYDFFGGDFGHCTKEGNALLANNVAEKISPLIK